MQLSRQDEPVYRELADILRRELSSYQAGEFLPGEVQLAERFGAVIEAVAIFWGAGCISVI